MNTFNVSHVFHIKKSAQLYIEEIQEKVEINRCVYNSDEYGNSTDGTLSPIFFYIYIWNYSWRHDTKLILSTLYISNTLNLQFTSCFQKIV